ncbi:Methionine--tRNA ligase [uncultured archaeon]|nr:Methionine--tRNA ligase [uncultured archaeon]
MAKILITSALPYVNNVPHLGNLIGCVLSADVFARFCRSRGYETLYICGTDEYGTATEAKAIEEGVSPREICDKYFKIHKSIYEWFNISTNRFGRTSDPIHVQHTQDIFLELHKNGMLLEKEVEQPYDQKVGLFLADRFVTGICPHCGSKDARADQCDKCGKLLTYSELGEPRSKLTGTTPVLKKTKHLFLDLAQSQPRLEKWIDGIEKEGRWSANTLAIARSWLKEGLQARSITRDLKWGVPVPLKGWENKVLYVWFDAPIGYVSITAGLTDKWKEWWLAGNEAPGSPSEVRHYEFIGKDNVPFHAIIFPAMLMGTRQPWTLPHYISSTEFLNYEDGKFSKSKGVGVFGNDAVESGIPADVWRYYLLATRPESADATFSWDEFGTRLNKELLGNWGNLVNRTLVFLTQNYEGVVPAPEELSEEDEAFLADVKIRLEREADLLEKVQIRAAVQEFMGAASAANAYLQAQAPWKSVRENPKRAAAALYCLANVIHDLAIASEPFLPSSSASVARQLGVKLGTWKDIGQRQVAGGHHIGPAEHLYKPLDTKALAGFREKYAGRQKKEGEEKGGKTPGSKTPGSSPASAPKKSAPAAPVAPLSLENLQLEVGLIESVERHPNAEKLYVEKIILANGEIRTICSGLVPYMKEEELEGRACVVVKNLKPAKLRGVESAGMILVAEEEGGKLELIMPPAPAGTPVQFKGITPNSQPPAISIDEFFTVQLTVKKGAVYANGHELLVDGHALKVQKVSEGKVS